MIDRIRGTTTGREKDLFQICQVLSDEFLNVQPSKDVASIILVLLAAALTICLMQAASEAPEDRSSRRRVTVRSEISRIGREKDPFHHPQQLHNHYAMEVDRTAGALQETQHSEEAPHHGAKAQAGRKMDLVRLGATSPKGNPLNEHLQLLNSTINGGQICDQTLQPNHLHRRQVLLVHQHHQRPLQCLLAGLS